MRIGCIIQARLDSHRFPRKIMADIGGWPMIKHVVKRAKTIGIPLFVAAPVDDAPEIASIVAKEDVVTFPYEGHLEDGLGRYLACARVHGLDGVMRITGDCPLIDPFACREVLRVFQVGYWGEEYPAKGHCIFDYVSNDIVKSYPDGMGCEIFTIKALRWADAHLPATRNDKLISDRAHVTPWIIRKVKEGYFRDHHVVCPYPKVAELKFSVDSQEDLDRAIAIDRAKPADYSLGATIDAYERSRAG